MSYLATEEVAQIVAGVEECPSNLDIPSLAVEVSLYIDEWLGYSVEVKEYREKLFANHRGLLVLKHTPVVEIISLAYVLPRLREATAIDLHFVNSPSLWDGKNIIAVAHCCDLNLQPAFEVNYRAGHQPIPHAFKLAAQKLVKAIAQEGAEALFAPYRTLKKVELPSTNGGLRREYQVGSVPSGTTLLDLILTPLLGKWRRQYFF